jgi:hypothetical protein
MLIVDPNLTLQGTWYNDKSRYTWYFVPGTRYRGVGLNEI